MRDADLWEAAAQVADTIAARYAERDASQTGFPMAETCAAVACAVMIASELRQRAADLRGRAASS